MRYPLGSFPQYGYQARNAAIRRQVAQENSAATLRAKAKYELMIEEAAYKYIDTLMTGATPKNMEGEKVLAELNARMDRILRYHDAGRRVYYKFLGETLRLFCTNAGMKTGLDVVDDEKLKNVARDLGLMVISEPEKLQELIRKEPMQGQPLQSLNKNIQ
jgi:hypothetical protein